jgi:predicted metal-dependent hydrolase
MAEERSKDQIYDEEISLLVQQLIELCTKNNIPALMNFDISDEHNPQLQAITCIPNENNKLNGRMELAFLIMAPDALQKALVLKH